MKSNLYLRNIYSSTALKYNCEVFVLHWNILSWSLLYNGEVFFYSSISSVLLHFCVFLSSTLFYYFLNHVCLFIYPCVSLIYCLVAFFMALCKALWNALLLQGVMQIPLPCLTEPTVSCHLSFSILCTKHGWHGVARGWRCSQNINMFLLAAAVNR